VRAETGFLPDLAAIERQDLRRVRLMHINFGVMVTVNMAIGANTPPVGVDLIAACKVGQTTLDDAMPYIWPFVAAMTVALIFVTFIPPLVTFIPQMFLR
jgi:TRAP-type C4-dicarboxylate transport system permease large subunit